VFENSKEDLDEKNNTVEGDTTRLRIKENVATAPLRINFKRLLGDFQLKIRVGAVALFTQLYIFSSLPW